MIDKNRVPLIRFKGFSENISFIKLKDVVLLNTYGPRFNANDYDLNGNVKTIRGTDISLNGNILYNQVPIAKLDLNFIKSHILEDGDLVMITTADCGLTGIFEKQKNNYICSAYAVKIVLNKKSAFPNYFKYFFQTSLAKNEVNKHLRTATISNLPASDILKITLMLPSIQEQEKIASFLNLIYELIEQKEKKYQKLKQFKKAILEKMFPKDGEDTPEIRFKGFRGEWKKETIKNIGIFFSGGTPISSNQSYYNGLIPFIGSGKISSETVEQFITEEALHNSSAKMVEIGDLLYALYGATSGEVAISKIKGAINQAVLCIRTDENKFFLETWLRKNKQNILSTYLQGGQGNLSAQIVKSLELYLPQKEEQTKIGNYFQKLDKLIDLQQKEIKKLKNIKKASLEKMFV